MFKNPGFREWDFAGLAVPLNHQKTICIGIKVFSIYGKLLMTLVRSAVDISKYPAAIGCSR
jgi:hypothetical protein